MKVILTNSLIFRKFWKYDSSFILWDQFKNDSKGIKDKDYSQYHIYIVQLPLNIDQLFLVQILIERAYSYVILDLIRIQLQPWFSALKSSCTLLLKIIIKLSVWFDLTFLLIKSSASQVLDLIRQLHTPSFIFICCFRVTFLFKFFFICFRIFLSFFPIF